MRANGKQRITEGKIHHRPAYRRRAYLLGFPFCHSLYEHINKTKALDIANIIVGRTLELAVAAVAIAAPKNHILRPVFSPFESKNRVSTKKEVPSSCG